MQCTPARIGRRLRGEAVSLRSFIPSTERLIDTAVMQFHINTNFDRINALLKLFVPAIDLTAAVEELHALGLHAVHSPISFTPTELYDNVDAAALSVVD